MKCRLIIHPPADAAWNMAVDEALLKSAASHGAPALRFYFWSEPALSLGYFQKFADRSAHVLSASCQTVRRASGGGAILHDQELTYSLSWPTANRFAASADDLYVAIHESLCKTLFNFGVSATLSTRETGAEDAPFLCFARRAVGDVLLRHHKIAGSAQRRLKGALLQHGSVLLSRSPSAPELSGIQDLTGIQVPVNQFIESWQDLIGERLNLQFVSADLTAEECQAATAILASKFGSIAWLHKR